MNIVFGYSSESKEIISNGVVFCSYSYDKKQEKYICKHIHESYKKGCKFLYSDSPSGLCIQLEKFYKNI